MPRIAFPADLHVSGMEHMVNDMVSVLGPAFRKLPRPLLVAEPCYGIGAFRELMMQIQEEYVSKYAYDQDARLEQWHKNLAVQDGKVPSKTGHFGAIKGDIRFVKLSDLKDVDALVAGAQGPPWAVARRAGVQDLRAEVFLTVRKWLVELGGRGSLKFFCVEASNYTTGTRGYNTRLLHMCGGADSFIDDLTQKLPEFHISKDNIQLENFIPHQRERCLVRGIRWDILKAAGLSSIPKPISAFEHGPVPLAQILDWDADNILPLGQFSDKKRENLTMYEAAIHADCADGLVGPQSIAAFDLCKPFVANRSGLVFYDRVPSLNPRGQVLDIILASVGDIEEPMVTRTSRLLLRPLTLGERFLLCGHPARRAKLGSKSATVSLTGTACPVPMMAAAVAPLVVALGNSGLVVASEMGQVSCPCPCPCPCRISDSEMGQVAQVASQIQKKTTRPSTEDNAVDKKRRLLPPTAHDRQRRRRARSAEW